MYLIAACVGEAVPRGDFAAAVHSVFRPAVNLRLKRGGRLLTLLAPGEADLPQGIRLEAGGSSPFEGIRSGEAVLCREGILRFENAPLVIQLRGARRWKCDLSMAGAGIASPAVPAAWRFVWEALNRRQRLSKAEIIAEDLFALHAIAPAGVARKAGEALQELVGATRRYDLAGSLALQALIGLGPGLTPSGDDLLAGYLAGLWCTAGDDCKRMRFISTLGKAIVRLSGQTNDISRTYLYHAARGRVSSRLADLAGAICHGESPERLLPAAESAMQVGHSSGMEAVTGLLAGLAAWANPAALPPAS